MTLENITQLIRDYDNAKYAYIKFAKEPAMPDPLNFKIEDMVSERVRYNILRGIKDTIREIEREMNMDGIDVAPLDLDALLEEGK